ncbi:DUF3685 domain-containing protein [Cyanobium sp. FGCU-52]|nr:DUF3685 domain-containing protein [Cyanobium sp. FGCU52]
MGRRQDPSLPLLLLFAEPLQREGLVRWLEQPPAAGRVVSDGAAGIPTGPGPVRLVIWALDGTPASEILTAELRTLQERWQPAPVLLLLPGRHAYPTELLLTLPVQGLLVNPGAEELREAVDTLLAGGRLVNILAGSEAPANDGADGAAVPLGLGQWLLVSGLQQIDAELAGIRRLLSKEGTGDLARLLLLGRLRELRMARHLLLWLWGPISMAWSPGQGGGVDREIPAVVPSSTGALQAAVSLTLRDRTADGIWEALRRRLLDAAGGGAENGSGLLLALDGLQAERRRDLLIALVEQFALLRKRLQTDSGGLESLISRWQERQPELRREALRQMAGSYVQLPFDGGLRPVADSLLRSSDLEPEDPELPDPRPMLSTLVLARPLLVNGRLLAPDEPQAVLYLEMLLANWLVRNAELVSAELLSACADWPELRRYLLHPEFLPTRNLEGLRNRLNAQQRWSEWFERPIHLYESRRPLYQLQAGRIRSIDLTEPRDAELRRLSWPQQLVTLILEARDALAPQLQHLVRGLGDLVVVLLTRVIGRAIGLVGRGILQGMGRSVGSRGARAQ